jgi:hypothetical protein
MWQSGESLERSIQELRASPPFDSAQRLDGLLDGSHVLPNAIVLIARKADRLIIAAEVHGNAGIIWLARIRHRFTVAAQPHVS